MKGRNFNWFFLFYAKSISPQLQKQCTHLIMTNSPFPATLANSPRSTHLFVAEQPLNLSCNLNKASVPLRLLWNSQLYQAILDCSNLSILCWANSFTKAAERRSFPDWAVDIWERLEYEGLGRKMHKDAKIAVWEWKRERNTGLGKWGCRKVNVDKRGKHTS